MAGFLSTSSARRTTKQRRERPELLGISIHVLREEDDRAFVPIYRRRYISIHVLREEDDSATCAASEASRPISIHVLREEDDIVNGVVYRCLNNFYPRPPRGGRRACRRKSARHWTFLSTSSARRTTTTDPDCTPRRRISIHVLREEDDPEFAILQQIDVISIHVLREEDDLTPSTRAKW